MAKKEKNTKLQRFLSFPERTKNSLLFFIVLLTFSLVIACEALILKDNDYNYEPNYEEIKYTEWVNPYIRVFNNYIYENDEIVNKYRVVGCYFGLSSAKKIIDYQADVLFITEGDEYIYKGDSSISTSSAYSNTNYYLNNEIISSGLIEKIYFKLNYTRFENNQKTKEEYIAYKEEILTLDKKEIKMDVCNDFDKLTGVIKSYTIQVKEEENQNKIYSKMYIDSSNNNDFHMDFQMFGITEDEEVYNLIGYYNLCNNYSNTMEHDTTVTNKIDFEYIIVKCVYEDETLGKTTIYIKKAFKDVDRV